MNWQTFKSLHELYATGKTKNRSSLVENAVIKYHTAQSRELLVTRNEIIVKKPEVFSDTFVNRYLAKFNECLRLLDDIGENTPQCRFEVDDILILGEIKAKLDNGELEEIRNQIIESNETRRGVSLMFFKHEKHLEGKEALERALKKILQIDAFADNRDFQYLYVLQCHHPKAIVLCENLYHLKMPEKARRNQLELWYAGGRNIEKLVYSQNRDLPIYYMCDWDYDGLDIYASVKGKIPSIRLLTPNGERRSIVKTEHKSLWRYSECPTSLSGLTKELYTDDQKKLIEVLINENTWIIEESNNLIELLKITFV
jgi:hypothetical protein